MSHQTRPASPRASPRKAAKKTEGTSATEDVLEEEAEIEAEVKAAKEGMVVHDDDDDNAESNDETIMYSFKDDGTGSSTSPKPMPTALTHIKRVQASHRGPEDLLSYNTLTHKTTISLPQDTMLVIPEDLSIQLRGKV